MTRAAPYDRDTALDAALDLFWRKGFHATSLKDLEAALSMKPGSIYAAFSSKEALFRATLQRYFARDEQALSDTARSTPAPLEALAEHLRRIGRPAPGKPRACMLTKTVLELAEDPSPAGTEARAYLDRIQDIFCTMFTRARDEGALPPEADPRRLARRFQSNIIALKIETQRGTTPGDLAALADEMADELVAMRPHPAR